MLWGGPPLPFLEEPLVLGNSWSVSTLAMLTGQMFESEVLRKKQACTFRHGINAFSVFLQLWYLTGKGWESPEVWEGCLQSFGKWNGELISWSLPFPQWVLILGKMVSPEKISIFLLCHLGATSEAWIPGRKFIFFKKQQQQKPTT